MTPEADDVQTVTGINVGEAKEHAVNEIDAATPETPAPVHTPVSDPDPAIDELRGVVEALATAVSVLTDTVTGQADESPVKTPWTHWGGQKS